MNPSARLSVSLLVGLVLWLPALGPCLRGDIGLPEAGIRYLVAFGFVSVALAALDRLIRAYTSGAGEDVGSMAAEGTETDHLLRREADGTIPRGAGTR